MDKKGFAGIILLCIALFGKAGGQVIDAARTPGHDLGQHLAAALAKIPMDGGIIDARGFSGIQYLSNNLILNKSNITILLGAYRLDMGNHSIVIPVGTENVALTGASPYGGLHSGRRWGGSYLIYQGAAAAVVVGSASDDTIGFAWKDIGLDIASAGPHAVGMNLTRVIDMHMQDFSVAGHFQEQVLIHLDGTTNYASGLIEDAELGGGKTAILCTSFTRPGGVNNLTAIHLHINAKPGIGSIGYDFEAAGDDTVIGGDVEDTDTAFKFGPGAENNSLFGVRYEGNGIDFDFDSKAARNQVMTGDYPAKVRDLGRSNVVVDGISAARLPH